ncbi:pentatricopeptide repeat-containing protein [Gossypium australe]|uniref:Pentatricopeptide repeat-containing protein n=1 Tax=Gossypium australe TaxID=47621 RepID=A0A5B6W0C5_9ROSI|nr:pentatricopeptide repeat-containing protein [Gossypium australe]
MFRVVSYSNLIGVKPVVLMSFVLCDEIGCGCMQNLDSALCLVDDEFNESESEEELSDFDGFDCAIGDDVFNNAGMNVCDMVTVNLDGLNMDDVQLRELNDSDKSKTLNNAHESDSFVGIDANNGIYPIAYAAVESENQASWCWFLELL